MIGSHSLEILSLAPFDPTAGIRHAGLEVYRRHLAHLAARHAVTVVAPGARGQENEITAPEGYRVIRLFPPTSSTLPFIKQAVQVYDAVRGVTAGGGYTSAVRSNRSMRELVARADLVEFQWSEMLSLLPMVREWSPDVRTCAFLHDLRSHHLASARQRMMPAAIRWKAKLRAPAAARVESTMLKLCDGAIVLSQPDELELSETHPQLRVLTIDAYIDLPSRTSQNRLSNRRVVFMGALDRFENNTGVTWLLEEVWPEVVKELPDAELIIAGSSPPAHIVEQIGRTSRAQLLANFPEEEHPYGNCRVVVAPLFVRGGIKLKVLEAVARAIPMVVTPAAAHGVIERLGTDSFIDVTDDSHAFAEALCRGLSDDELVTAVSNNLKEKRHLLQDQQQSAALTSEFYSSLTS